MLTIQNGKEALYEDTAISVRKQGLLHPHDTFKVNWDIFLGGSLVYLNLFLSFSLANPPSLPPTPPLSSHNTPSLSSHNTPSRLVDHIFGRHHTVDTGFRCLSWCTHIRLHR